MTNGLDVERVQDLRLSPVDADMYISGQWISSRDRFEVLDPATLDVVATVADATPQDVASAVQSAAASLTGWRSSLPSHRHSLLTELATLIERDSAYLAGLVTLETGKPLAEAQGEVMYARDFALWYAEEARRIFGYTIQSESRPNVQLSVTRHPLGIVLALVPWNYPVVLLCRKLFAAMAAGNTVIVKPSEKTPLSALHLMKLLEEAATPPGVVNCLTTSNPHLVTSQLLADKRIAHVSFTGSVATGKLLASLASANLVRLSLELGGHNPMIVLGDSDVSAAAKAAAHARLRNGGQTCVSPNRVYVEDTVIDEFLESYIAELQTAVVGDGFQPPTTIGPMIDGTAGTRIEHHLDDALGRGARLECGGDRVIPRPECKGFFLQPAILTNLTPDMLILREETFGPVSAVIPFHDVADAVEWANDTDYGLAAYVFTTNLGLAMRLSREIEAGMVVVNQASGSGVQAPQGGIKQSGFGLEGGREGLEEFTYQKYVSLLA